MANQRDCDNCVHHKPDGCESWECLFEARMVEVVRCRDCKHYRPDAEPEYEMCRHHIIYMEPEDWCSYGERREP